MTVKSNQLTFSEKECPVCGWRHQVDAFRPGERVRVLSQHREAEGANYVGCVGRVVSWTHYGGPVYVRVVFYPPDSDSSGKENFEPCELEHV